MTNEASAWTLHIREQLAALKARHREQQLADAEALFEATAEHEQELAWQVEELHTEVAGLREQLRLSERTWRETETELKHWAGRNTALLVELAASAERETGLVAALDKRHGVEVALDAAESKVFQLQAKLAASAEREAALRAALLASLPVIVDKLWVAEVKRVLAAHHAAHPPAGVVELTCRCCGLKVMQPEEDAVDLCAACYRGKGGDTDEPCAAHPPAGAQP